MRGALRRRLVPYWLRRLQPPSCPHPTSNNGQQLALRRPHFITKQYLEPFCSLPCPPGCWLLIDADDICIPPTAAVYTWAGCGQGGQERAGERTAVPTVEHIHALGTHTCSSVRLSAPSISIPGSSRDGYNGAPAPASGPGSGPGPSF